MNSQLEKHRCSDPVLVACLLVYPDDSPLLYGYRACLYDHPSHELGDIKVYILGT